MRDFLIFVSMLVISSFLAAFDLPDIFPETEIVFEKEFAGDIVDFEMDSVGRLYVLTESAESLSVLVLDMDGNITRTIDCDKGITPAPHPVRIEVSRGGEIVLVWGLDTGIDTPINWVFDESGKDILPPENVLKFAEWLQVSPSGNYFTCQGFKVSSGINNVYRRDWTPVKWERRFLHHGYFVGIDSGEEVLLFTESDTMGTGLAMAKLPSQEDIFRRHLPPNESFLLPHRGRMAASENLLVMNYPGHLGGQIYGIDPSNGKIIWTVDPATRATDMIFSDDSKYIAVFGGPTIQILDVDGNEVASKIQALADITPFGGGIPDAVFFGKYRIVIASFYLPGKNDYLSSTAIRFDDNWETTGPFITHVRVEGFALDAGPLIVTATGDKFIVHRILPE